MPQPAALLRRLRVVRGLSTRLHLFLSPYATSGSDSWLSRYLERTTTSFCTWSSCQPLRGAGHGHAIRARRTSMATASSEPDAPASHTQLLAFFKSTFGKLEGRNYIWLNNSNGSWENFNRDGIYLALLYRPCEIFSSSSKLSAAFQRLKYIQQRYQRLNVFAMQCGSSVNSPATQSQVVYTLMKEYITFPVLISDEDLNNVRSVSTGNISHIAYRNTWTSSRRSISTRLHLLRQGRLFIKAALESDKSDTVFASLEFFFLCVNYVIKIHGENKRCPLMSVQMTNGACYLLFEGSKDHLLLLKWDEEPEIMVKEIDRFNAVGLEVSDAVKESKADWQIHEAIKEPSVGSLRNLFLYYPGCVSVDEDGDRIFISDSNHHRIIISSGDGKILDYIGSSPGFEDSEFESAKLSRPAASYYHAAEDCLYVVDSENHAIRKADFEKRILQTVYPVCGQKNSGIWSWIVGKLGLTREVAPKIQEFDADAIAFPWHLLKIAEDDLLIVDHNFEKSWIISMSTGEIRDILRGRAKVIKSCQQMISNRWSLLKDMQMTWLSRTREHTDSLEEIPHVELISSIARFQKYIVFCDTAGQRVLKRHMETNKTTSIQFSNFGMLGLPYWMVCPLEKLSSREHATGQCKQHIHHLNVLPGRCTVRVFLDIPVGTELAAPLDQSCIWRQARGSGAEISHSDAPVTTTEKVGVAQQWFDELDNLAFTTPGAEPADEDTDIPADTSYQEQSRVHFDCNVNISPGTCEVVVSAVLYLKIEKTKDDWGEQKTLVKRIIDCRNPEDHAGINLFMESGIDARDAILMKPLHLRLKLECADHPAGETNKETINTESSFQINISLD